MTAAFRGLCDLFHRDNDACTDAFFIAKFHHRASWFDSFNQNGLIVTESWILQGSGSPPILMGENAFEALDFDSLAQENLLLLNKKIKNFVFGQVKNNLLSPCIKYGDYVGGSDVSLDVLGSLIGEIMFLKQHNGLIAGILETDGEQVILRNIDRISKECFNKKSIESAGKIQWIARRL